MDIWTPNTALEGGCIWSWVILKESIMLKYMGDEQFDDFFFLDTEANIVRM